MDVLEKEQNIDCHQVKKIVNIRACDADRKHSKQSYPYRGSVEITAARLFA